MLNGPFGWSPSIDPFALNSDMVFVYVAWCRKPVGKERIFKIGISKTPRLRVLGCGKNVYLLFFQSFSERNARWMEVALHRFFSDKRRKAPPGCSGITEWFALSPEDLGLIQYGLTLDVNRETGEPEELRRRW